METALAVRANNLSLSAMAKALYFCASAMTLVCLSGALAGRAPIGNLKGAFIFGVAAMLLRKAARAIRTPSFSAAGRRDPEKSRLIACSFGLPGRYEIGVWLASGLALFIAFQASIVAARTAGFGAHVPVNLIFMLCFAGFIALANWGLTRVRNRMRTRFPDVPQIWTDGEKLVFGQLVIPWRDIVEVRRRRVGRGVIGADAIGIVARSANGIETVIVESSSLVGDVDAIVSALQEQKDDMPVLTGSRRDVDFTAS